MLQVKPLVGKGKAGKAAAKETAPKGRARADQQGPSLDDSLEENTKDTGQEKDAGTPKGQDEKEKPKETGVMDSPRYLRSPRDKSQERSASPFRRNIVEPLSTSVTAAAASGSQGSLASLRSEGSSASKGGFSFWCSRITTNSNTSIVEMLFFSCLCLFPQDCCALNSAGSHAWLACQDSVIS